MLFLVMSHVSFVTALSKPYLISLLHCHSSQEPTAIKAMELSTKQVAYKILFANKTVGHCKHYKNTKSKERT